MREAIGLFSLPNIYLNGARSPPFFRSSDLELFLKGSITQTVHVFLKMKAFVGEMRQALSEEAYVGSCAVG